MKNKKGVALSTMMVLFSIAISVLSFTTNCELAAELQNNPYINATGTNAVDYTRGGVSVLLMLFTGLAAIYERSMNGQLQKAKSENAELKSQISQTDRAEDQDVQEIHNNNPDDDTPKSIVTQYPKLNKSRL